jgi:hypothetical protein
LTKPLPAATKCALALQLKAHINSAEKNCPVFINLSCRYWSKSEAFPKHASGQKYKYQEKSIGILASSNKATLFQ